MLEPGQVVAGYRVEASIGAGAMGEVYKVRHVDRGTVHALKYLPLPARKVRQRILREAQAQTRLSHPNVVCLTEVVDIDGDPGLIMDYVDGPSLHTWLQTNKPTLAQAEVLFRGMVAGVAHAHRRGLVHRDLKPANVMLARTASGLVPKVCDFGIAKVVDSSNPSPVSGITRTGMSLGSPAYMAPEQMRDAREVDAGADVWSLGCLLYELVLFRRAFDSTDILDVMNAAQAARYTPPREIRPELPERFVRAIEGCLKADPDDRLESCDALLAVLDDGGSTTAVNTGRGITPTNAVGRGPGVSMTTEGAPGVDPRFLIGAFVAFVLAVTVLAAVVWLA